MVNKKGNTNTNSQPPRMPQPPMRNIDFQVDTIPERTDAAAYMDHYKNTITSNFIKGDSKASNQYNQSTTTLLHEQKHRDNINQGLYEYPVSPEQSYKLNMYDEISAMTTELVALREEYIRTGDISVFDKIGGRFRFYKEAIEKGKINPKSNNPADFDKDMRLIVNGTKDMWMRNWAPTKTYIDECAGNGYYYGDKTGKYSAFYDQNYERGKKIALTIGGVDFTQYLDKDVEIPKQGKFKLTEYLGKISNQEFTKNAGLPAYDGSMSLQQYQNYLQHYFMKESFDKGNLDIIAMKHIVTNPEEMEDLAVKAIGESKSAGFANIKANKDLITAAVTIAAKDYAKRGDKLPEGNDEAYNNAVNKLYEVEKGEGKNARKVNVREDLNLDDKDFDNNLPIRDLSEDVKEIVSENSSFWNRMKTKCKNALISVKNVFSSDKDKNKSVKNEVINPVDKNKKPEYRQWEDKDGSRVSKVQHINLPDMTKNVIQKPSNYNIENKTLNTEDISKEKMCAIIDYMNKINGQGKTIDTEKAVENLRKTYGDNALSLLQTAVNEPANYAKYVGDASIKTSRAAVQHLCNIKEPEKAVQEITQRKVSPKYESSVKEQLKQAAASRATAKPKEQKLSKPLKQQMSEDAKKYQTQKKVRRQQQQKTTAPRYENTVKNDNIPARQQLTPAMKIMQLRGVERSTPAQKVIKREISGNMRKIKQRTND